MLTLSITAIIYLGIIGYLGFRGYKATKTDADYLVAGRATHPYVMALSYGATFISTSAIIGFGGASAVFGMGLLWLTFLNIFLGIFVSFVFLGRRTRRMGHRLGAHTFPELIGKRFNSRFIQAFTGLIILIFMPLYASAVLIAAARYLEVQFQIPFNVAVAIFSIIIAGYVVAGGLKSVMYTDALQGSLMFIGMFLLLIFTYSALGGVTKAHHELDELPAKIEQQYQALVPEIRALAPADLPADETFAWFGARVGELKAATADKTPEEVSEIFASNPTLAGIGKLMKGHPELKSKLVIAKISGAGFDGWTRLPKTGSNFFYVLITSIIMGVGIGVLAQPQLSVRFMTVKSTRELNRAVLIGGIFILMMTGVAFIVGNLSNAWFARPENGGTISLAVTGNIDTIIPEYITRAMPKWFGGIFMLTLLSAAMSTLSSQFHAMGTSIGRDFIEKGILGSHEQGSEKTVLITRCGVILAIIITVILSFKLPEGIVATATAIFFGLCASAFIPMYIGGLYWKRMTKAGAIASLCAGFGVSFFWLMFVQQIKGKIPAMLAQAFMDKATLIEGAPGGIHWAWLDALFIALPVSIIVAIVVSLMTQPESDEHLSKCFD